MNVRTFLESRSVQQILVTIGIMAPVLTALLAVPLGSGTASVTPTTTRVATVIDSKSTLNPKSIEVITKTNDFRKQNSLPPLEVDSRIGDIAQNWSESMLTMGELNHRPNSQQVFPSDAMAMGENVYWSSLPTASAGEIVQGWIDSPGHRANILNPLFTHIGVGISAGTAGTYATQNFARF